VFARTSKDRRRNSAIVNRRRVLLEAWVEPKLRKAMRKLANDSALEYSRGGIGRVQVIAIADYKAEIRDILSNLYTKTAKSMADLVVDSAKNLGAIYETKELDDVVLERTLEWFGIHALEQAKLVSDTMFDEVQGIIEQGIAEGLGEREIGRRIVKDVGGLANWQANRIARTETLMASSHSQDEFIRNMDDMPELAKEWDSSRDSRTRRDHRGVEPVFMDERFKVGGKLMKYPGDRAGGPENVVNCLLPDTVVGLCHPKKLFRRLYIGEVVEIETSVGHKLSVTPNHPILTDIGWKPASLIEEQDNVVVDVFSDYINVMDIDINGVNTTVSDLFDSFVESGNSPSVASGIMNFHGDMFDSDVDVVDIAGPLVNGGKPSVKAPLENNILELSESVGVCLVDDGSIDKFLFASLLPSNSIVSGFRDFLNLLWSCIFEADDIRLASSSGLQSELLKAIKHKSSVSSDFFSDSKNGIFPVIEPRDLVDELLPILGMFDAKVNAISSNGVVGNPEELSDVLSGFPLIQKLLNNYLTLRGISKRLAIKPVTKVNFVHYDGPVYNIEDYKIFYGASSIINHNCRCVCNYAPADQIQELRDEVEEREQDTQDAILADLEEDANES